MSWRDKTVAACRCHAAAAAAALQSFARHLKNILKPFVVVGSLLLA